MVLKRIIKSLFVRAPNGCPKVSGREHDDDVTLTSSYSVYRHLLKTNHCWMDAFFSILDAAHGSFPFSRRINKNKWKPVSFREWVNDVVSSRLKEKNKDVLANKTSFT
ncbi:hypothetical protein AVEN_17805-1 [Araneus ventricosus]|uniref:Uncharacterized protein n=1 Tax=Araneus ventricosus TaxID=182803 RepID=A0A4Y1ZKT9_ARAVE|nr:hypothetical protein AVEN_17805-1 [Araneus ventricosus]